MGEESFLKMTSFLSGRSEDNEMPLKETRVWDLNEFDIVYTDFTRKGKAVWYPEVMEKTPMSEN